MSPRTSANCNASQWSSNGGRDDAMMEVARQGGVVFRCLCVQTLGCGPAPPGPSEAAGGQSSWESRVVPAQMEQYQHEHFVDADPTPFLYWLDYIRSGQVPFVKAVPKREKVHV